MELEKNIQISELNRIYGKLLTEKQRTFVDMYYNYDISLSEIAQNLNLSRQLVYDTIKKATIQLNKYELDLKILSKLSESRKIFDNNSLKSEEKLSDLKKIMEID